MRQFYLLYSLFIVLIFPAADVYAYEVLPLTAQIAVNDNIVCQNGTNPIVTFTGGGGAPNYTFTYTINGNPQTDVISSGPNDTFTMSVPTSVAGNFTYTIVSIKDSNNITQAINGVSVTINVRALPNVDFNFTNNQCASSPVQFNSVVSPPANYDYEWTFGTEGNSAAANPSHLFTAIGNGTEDYTVSLKVTNTVTGCFDVVSKLVTVKEIPDAKLNGTGSGSTFAGVPVFKVCGTSSAAFNFTNASTTSGTNTNYTIDWGDSSTPYNSTTLGITSHNYQVGLWNLIYTVEGQNGCIAVKHYIVFVGSNPAVSLGNPGNTEICNSQQLTFPITGTTNNTPGTIYTVTFNDGSSPEIYNHPPPGSVTHTFPTSSCGVTSSDGSNTYPNSFSVNIVASNPCSTSSVGVVPIYVSTPPQAEFISPPSSCVNNMVCFQNNSIGANEINSGVCNPSPPIIWSISPSTGYTLVNGSSLGSDFSVSDPNLWLSGSANLCVQFTTTGNYTISLKTANKCGSDIKIKPICIEGPITPAFTINNTEGCTPLAINTNNTTDISGLCNAANYTWSVTYTASNCGVAPVTIANQTTANASYNFTIPGTYTIRLTMTNSCGSFNTTRVVTVKQPPIVNINNIPDICATASSTINPTANVTNCGTQTPTYAWTFAGSTTPNINTANPGTITYNTPGTKNVTLVVTNECGVSTTATTSFNIKTAPTVTNATLSQTICSGQQTTAVPLTASIPNATFSWTAIATAGISGAVLSGNASTIPVQTIVTSAATPGTVTYTITPAFNGCPGPTVQYVINVNPAPLITTQPSPSSTCVGTAPPQLSVAYQGGSGVPGYQWFSNNINSVTGATPIGSATSATFQPPGMVTGITYYFVTITFGGGGGCASINSLIVPVTINPLPVIAAMTADTCSGTAFTATPSNSGGNIVPAGTTYSWTTPTGSGFTGGSAQSNQATISQVLTNITNAAVTATYTITPKAGTCTGSPFQLTVTINPKPAIPDQAIAICSSATFTVTPVNNGAVIVPAGTLYSWNAPSVPAGVSGAAAGSAQPSFSGTLNSTANTPRIVNYMVTPVAPDGNCAGNSFNVAVTVNPLPVIAAKAVNVCSGNAVSLNLSNTLPDIIPANTEYTWPVPVISPSGSVTGAAASGTPQTVFNPILTNTTNAQATVTYTLTPKSGNCTGVDFIVTVTVMPKPVIDNIANQILCNGTQTDAVAFGSNVSGSTYSWTNSTPSIGLPASGNGDIAAFAAINNGSTPVTATITVTPTANSCAGASKSFTITVNPAPAVNFSITNQQICSGAASTTVTLSSTTPGATFTWASVVPSGITGVVTSGTDTIPAQTLTNTTNAPIIISYTASALTTGVTCEGAEYIHTITVNPVPSVTTPQSATTCSGTAFVVTPTDGSGNNIPAGTTYSWTMPTGGPVVGASAQTDQPTISQTLINNTNTPANTIYTVTPKTGNCSGAPFPVNVMVRPMPKVLPQAQQICTGSTFTITPANNAPSQIIPAGTVYSWPAPAISGSITGGTSGTNAADISGTLTNNSNTSGTATYTVTPISGSCAGIPFTVVITVNPVPVVGSPQQDDICNGEIFSVTPVNGGSNIIPSNTTYTWSAPLINPPGLITGGSAQSDQTSISQTLNNISNTPATATYTVAPKSGNCTGNTFSVIITVNPVTIVDDVPNQTVCSGDNVTSVNFTSLVANTIFHWTNSNPSIGLAASGTGDIASFTASNAGTSPVTTIITITPEINGCNGPDKPFTITVNPAPSVQFSMGNQTICSGAGTAAVTLSSTTPNASFSWNAVMPAGITGMVTSGTDTIPVQTLVNSTVNPITVTYTAIASTIGISCAGVAASYNITVNPVPFVNAPQATAVCSGTAANFIPSNGSGNNIPPGATYIWTAPTGTGFTGGSAQVVPQSSFNATLVNTTLNPVTATYIVTAEFNNCPGIPFQLTVTINPKATIASTAATICSEGTFTINPSDIPAAVIPPGTTYSWSAPVVTGGITGGIAGNGNSISGTLTNPSNTNQTATYTVTPVSSPGNCSGNPFNIVVTVSPEFTVTSTVSDYNGFEISTAGANDGAINLTPSGGSGVYTFAWTGPGGFNAQTENISNLGPGNYSVTIGDGLCNNIILNFQIDEPLLLIIQEVVFSHNNLKCFGDTDGVIEVAVTQVSIAPFDYTIKIQGGAVIETVMNSNAENYVFDNLSAGTYDIIVTDANGTVKQLLGIVITQPANPLTISAAAISNHNGFSITCNGANDGSIDLTISGGTPVYSYSWTGPGTFTASTQDITGLSPGAYNVTVTDNTGICNAIGNYNITEPLPLTFIPTVSDYNGNQISCFGFSDGSISIVPSGGTGSYSYWWTGPNGYTASTQNISNLVIGTYHLDITDTNNCVNSTGTYTLNQPPPLGITETHVNILCFGAATGSITVNVTGGTPIEITPGNFDYNYAWTGPNSFSSNAKNLTNIPAGTYNLTATDKSGCTIQLQVILTQPNEIIITPVTTPISCYGANDASITLNVTGGVGPYQANWDTLATGFFQDNLAAGNYTITITDTTNCIKVIVVNIPEAPVFMVNPTSQQISCFGANDGSISLNLTGGIAPVVLVWSDGSSAGTQRNNLGPGTYTATITDAKPCVLTRTFVIIEPQPLVLAGNVTHALDCDDANSGAINLLVSGGTPPFQYNWSNNTNTEDLSNIPAGNYMVTVTDSHNCVQTASYSINRQPPLIANVITDTDFDCDTHMVQQSFIAAVEGGVPPYTYVWSNGTVSGAQGEIMNTEQNGAVVLDVTDSMGCHTNYSFNVDIPELGYPSFDVSSYAFTTYGAYSIIDPIQFTNTATGDYASVSWDFGDGSVSTDENPTHAYVREGDYVVVQTVSYPLGCIYTHIITIKITKGYELIMPTAFTPNKDVVNDNFAPVYRGLDKVRIDIYDTWGAMIYSEEAATLKGWDGTVKGLDSENGNYYFRVSATTFYGSVITADGPFTLIK